jgi:hypothetical protein
VESDDVEHKDNLFARVVLFLDTDAALEENLV